MQIRLSSVVFAALHGVGLVAGLIAFSPALTRMYYVHLALLTLGAGACVTLYNRRAAHRVRPRADAAPLAFEEDPDAVPEPITDAAAAGAPPADPAVCTAPERFASMPGGAVPVDHAADGAHSGASLPTSAAAVVIAAEEERLPTDLDALLDIAYESAAQNPARAIRAYREALARHPGDSYMPYLVIELSTLYKNMGDYGAARSLFNHALTLPSIARNPVIVQEFQRSLRYMDALSLLLALRGTPTLPFGDVPKDLIDAANRQADEAYASHP